MTTPAGAATDTRPATPNPNFEPDEEWKANLRQRIEVTLQPAAEKLKQELNEKLKSLSSAEASKAHADYDNGMAELRHAAEQRFHQLLALERRERQWDTEEKADEKWAETLAKENQALLDAYKSGTNAKTDQPGATQGEERNQPPSLSKPTERASPPSDPTAKDCT
jgi:predicted dehydrogenase